MVLRHHAVLAVVSHGCPPPKDRYLRVTHPSATDSRSCPCDLHVLSMPPAFALSQDQTLRFISAAPKDRINEQTRTRGCRPPGSPRRTATSKRTVTHQKDTSQQAPKHLTQQVQVHSQNPNHAKPGTNPSNPERPDTQGAANVSLPSLCNCQRSHPNQTDSQPTLKQARQTVRSRKEHLPRCMSSPQKGARPKKITSRRRKFKSAVRRGGGDLGLPAGTVNRVFSKIFTAPEIGAPAARAVRPAHRRNTPGRAAQNARSPTGKHDRRAECTTIVGRAARPRSAMAAPRRPRAGPPGSRSLVEPPTLGPVSLVPATTPRPPRQGKLPPGPVPLRLAGSAAPVPNRHGHPWVGAPLTGQPGAGWVAIQCRAMSSRRVIHTPGFAVT